MTADPAFTSFVVVFTVGYLLCLLTPGPNFILLAGVAVARGMKGSLPVCWGITLGSLLLSAGLFLLSEMLPEGRVVDRAAHVVSAMLMAYIAWRLLKKRPPVTDPSTQRADFGVGFCTSLVNPVTGAFFASQFLALPARATQSDYMIVFAIIAGVAFIRSIAIAVVFGSWSANLARLRTSAWPSRIGGVIFLQFAILSLWSAAKDMV